MAKLPSIHDERRRRIVQALSGRTLREAIELPDVRKDLYEEAAAGGDDALVTPEMLANAEKLRAYERQAGPTLQLFYSTDDLILVPGFLGSALYDVGRTASSG